ARDEDGRRAIGRRNAGRHAGRGFDGCTEGMALAKRAVGDEQRYAELAKPVLVDGQAYEASRTAGHQVDHFGRDAARARDQVAAVFRMILVEENDAGAATNLTHRDRELGKFSVCGARHSNSPSHKMSSPIRCTPSVLSFGPSAARRTPSAPIIATPSAPRNRAL